MADIMFLADGPKSTASVFHVVLYHISNLKSIGQAVLKISRSQVGRTDGRKDERPAFPFPTQTSFVEDKNVLKISGGLLLRNRHTNRLRQRRRRLILLCLAYIFHTKTHD